MAGDCLGEMLARDTQSLIFTCVNGEGIDELYPEYQDRKVECRRTIANKPWRLREFVEEPPEGHRIRFGQTL